MRVLLARFPFTDVSATKLRPVLVLAELPGQNTIVCKISSVHRPHNQFEIPIKGHYDRAINASYAHLDTIFTIHQSLISRSLGDISHEGFNKQVRRVLKQLFSL